MGKNKARVQGDTVLSTVGTSLLGNLKRLDAREHPDVSELLEKQDAPGIARYLRSKFSPADRETGAEINSLEALERGGYLFASGKRGLIFFVSDTDDGAFVGEILRGYYRDRFDPVDIIPVLGLTDTDVHSFCNVGLRNLVREMSAVIRRARQRGCHPMINATGGYKAQISFAGLIGQAVDVYVFYLFERFNEIIPMPPMPVSFDLSLWLDHFDLFEDLSEDFLPLAEVDIDALDPRLAPLLQIEEEQVMLSAMGELFHEFFFQQFPRQSGYLLPPDSHLDPADKKRAFGADHHRAQGIETYFQRLAQIPYVKGVQTTYVNVSLKRPTGFKVQPGRTDVVFGQFTDGKSLSKFEVLITATKRSEAVAAVADLTLRLLK